MSEFHVEVVTLEQVEKHPEADTLSIAHIHGGYPVVFKTESFSPGGKAVYVPIDALVPLSDDRFSFLSDRRDKAQARIKAKKLRGIFSMGMLVPAEPHWEVGQNVQAELQIEKWEPPPPKNHHTNQHSEQEKDPGIIPVYTDLDSVRKYGYILEDGEEVVITEKIHGANARFVYAKDEFWVGSHKTFKKRDALNMWWQVAENYGLEEKCKSMPDFGLYGEVYGQVQDLKYGAKQNELMFAAFDIFDCKNGKYLDYDAFIAKCKELEIPTAPVLFRGPWATLLREMAEGNSTLADHVREGFVVKPTKERWSPKMGRVALKLVGQGYLLRKSA